MSFRGFGYSEEDEYCQYQTNDTRKTSTSMKDEGGKHYETLGLPKHASQAEVKKGYINAAKIHHPDKGGDADKFREIQQAYETLNDPQKRRLYDLYGDKGKPQVDFDTSDLINLLFGRRFGTNTSSSARNKPMMKTKPVKIILHVTLQDIYNGHVFKIGHRRNRCCTTCNGAGGQRQTTCKSCKGKGTFTRLTQLMPGMYQQSQATCTDCAGKGSTLDWSSLCTGCRGAKVISTEKVLEVAVEKGTPNNYDVVLNGEGDQQPGYLAGDVIASISVAEHPEFKRVGADLYMNKKISLFEALTGVKSSYTHLDGTVHNMQTAPGEIINFTDRKTIYGLGLPFFRDSMSHGNLIIDFEVQMPSKYNNLSPEQIRILGEILPGRENQMHIPGRPTQQLRSYRQDDLNTNPHGGKQAEESKYDQHTERPGCGTH